jgi:glutathione synthase/RimK-type ligase-like ATP-grasp enzyme
LVNEIPKSLSILREACVREGISFEIVDSFTGFVASLSKSGQRYLVGAAGIGVYPTNRAAPFAIARDKAFTHYVLRRAGFLVPEGEHFFLRAPHNFMLPDGRGRAEAVRYARRLSDNYALPLIVKPNSGKGAHLVSYSSNEEGLNAALDVIGAADHIGLIQSFVDSPEYRLFLVDGEIAFAYRKSRPAILGDGQMTIGELLTAGRPAADASVSDYLRKQMLSRALTLQSVLEAGARLETDIVANLSAGGHFAGFIEPSQNTRAWARKLAKAVSLRVTGVDVFSASELTDLDDAIVTDVNGSPNLGTLFDLGHRDLVFAVWQIILRKTFDEPWPKGF